MTGGGPATAGGGPATAGGTGRRLAQLAELGVEVLRGVGSGTAASLGALDIATVLDLLTHYPRRYIDATRQAPVAQLVEGERVTVLAEVVRVSQASPGYGRSGRGRGRRPPSRVEVVVTDGTDRLRVVFFNQTWRARQLPAGTTALFFGTVSSYRDALQMANPMVDVLAKAGDDDGTAPDAADRHRVFPVYPLSEKADLTSAGLAKLVGEALDRAGPLADPVDGSWLREYGLVDRTTAFSDIHRPVSVDRTEPARRRLAFDELLRLQLALVLRQARLQADARGIAHAVTDDGPTLTDRFLAGLPFALTDAQRRAVAGITADLAGPLPMHRLLQGDVGAGKTVVAAAAMLVAVGGGHQAALMAPTEVLAEQHAAEVRRLIGDLEVPDPGTLAGTRPLRVGLLTNRTSAAERAALRDGLEGPAGAPGAVDVLVGTHALLVDDVTFRSLGVAVIDEQHRFGVEQRAALRDKGRGPDGTGRDPDLLVMTATPIPRTAAMVVFGDLDMTVVDELPPGRQPVATTWLRGPEAAAEAWDRVREQVAAGHRAFVVCPLVEGSERVEARSATAEAERLAADELAGLAVGLLHGQMRPADKEATMAAFRAGELDVLVATTVIEVGVDVPAASVMVIEDADRFGIAQLHQLRGRVGRGGDPAWCYLLSDADTPEAETRLTAMERTTDGFELADVDLQLRGEGTILGARQKGRSDLKAARLLDDRDLVAEARTVAESLVEGDPGLADHPLLVDELEAVLDDEEREFLFKS